LVIEPALLAGLFALHLLLGGTGAAQRHAGPRVEVRGGVVDGHILRLIHYKQVWVAGVADAVVVVVTGLSISL